MPKLHCYRVSLKKQTWNEHQATMTTTTATFIPEAEKVVLAKGSRLELAWDLLWSASHWLAGSTVGGTTIAHNFHLLFGYTHLVTLCEQLKPSSSRRACHSALRQKHATPDQNPSHSHNRALAPKPFGAYYWGVLAWQRHPEPATRHIRPPATTI